MISVVIPTFNRKESVLQLVDDVCRQEGVDFEVIVVDDASRDGTVEAIRERFPMVVILQNDKNQGVCVARNRGIRQAQGSVVVGFDSDVRVPDRKMLSKVAAFFCQTPDVDGVSFRLFLEDSTTDDVDRWWHPVPIARYANQNFLTDYFSGTAFAFRTRVLREIGMFPEIVYQHSEEMWVALRLLDHGSNLAYEPDLWVLHHAHLTVDRKKNLRLLFYKTRNQILLTFAFYPFLRGVAYLFPRLVYNGLKAFRGGYLLTFGRALSDGVKNIPIVWRKRRPVSLGTFQRIAAIRKGMPLLRNEKEVDSDKFDGVLSV